MEEINFNRQMKDIRNNTRVSKHNRSSLKVPKFTLESAMKAPVFQPSRFSFSPKITPQISYPFLIYDQQWEKDIDSPYARFDVIPVVPIMVSAPQMKAYTNNRAVDNKTIVARSADLGSVSDEASSEKLSLSGSDSSSSCCSNEYVIHLD